MSPLSPGTMTGIRREIDQLEWNGTSPTKNAP